MEGYHKVVLCRHITKCRVLAFVLDLCPEDRRRKPERESTDCPSSATHAAALQLQVLVSELHEYDPRLLQKPSVIVLNKSDTAPDPDIVVSDFMSHKSVRDSCALLPGNSRVMLTSATRKHGLNELQSELDAICLDELGSGVQSTGVLRHDM